MNINGDLTRTWESACVYVMLASPNGIVHREQLRALMPDRGKLSQTWGNRGTKYEYLPARQQADNLARLAAAGTIDYVPGRACAVRARPEAYGGNDD